MIGLAKLASYGFRTIKAVPKLLFGTGSEAVGSAIRSAVRATKGGSIFTTLKAAGKAGLTTLESGPTGMAFLRGVGKDILGLPKFLGSVAKSGFKAAKAAGKSGIWGGIKGFFSGAAKKMPLIGTLLMIGFELPNIFRAGLDKGAGEALVETGKAAARLTGGAAGAAIGSAICPGIGSIIGWIAGEWLTSKVTGKTYTEKKEEAELQAQQQAAIEQYRQLGLSDADIQYCMENGISPQDAQQLLLQQQGVTTNPATQQQIQQTGIQQPATSYAYPSYPMPTGMSDPFSSMGYNQFGTGNSYSNDFFYQQLFGSNTGVNPSMTATYNNPYMMYPQQGLQYSA